MSTPSSSSTGESSSISFIARGRDVSDYPSEVERLIRLIELFKSVSGNLALTCQEIMDSCKGGKPHPLMGAVGILMLPFSEEHSITAIQFLADWIKWNIEATLAAIVSVNDPILLAHWHAMTAEEIRDHMIKVGDRLRDAQKREREALAAKKAADAAKTAASVSVTVEVPPPTAQPTLEGDTSGGALGADKLQ